MSSPTCIPMEMTGMIGLCKGMKIGVLRGAEKANLAYNLGISQLEWETLFNHLWRQLCRDPYCSRGEGATAHDPDGRVHCCNRASPRVNKSAFHVFCHECLNRNWDPNLPARGNHGALPPFTLIVWHGKRTIVQDAMDRSAYSRFWERCL